MNILKRLFNLISIVGAVVLADGLLDIMTTRDGVYIGIGFLVFVLAVNYTFFGKATFWNVVDD